MQSGRDVISSQTGNVQHASSQDINAFEYIIALIYERARIRLHEGKHELIRARLSKRMRELGIGTLTQYCEYLRSSGDNEEVTHAVDALTTNFTHFLRGEDHFRFLVQKALPEVLGGHPRSFHIWSAACATGEEPLSIAMYLAEHYPPANGWDWRISATDVSTRALKKAGQGVYEGEKIRALPEEWLRRYFQKGVRSWEGFFRIKREIAERVAYQQINLLSSYQWKENFEVIFCRNVMIYFDRGTQEQLVKRLTRFLIPKGFLVIGQSESLNGINAGLRCLKPSIYQKL